MTWPRILRGRRLGYPKPALSPAATPPPDHPNTRTLRLALGLSLNWSRII